MTSVRFRDGIEVDLPGGRRLVADASVPDGDVNVLTHAHGDHLYDERPGPLVCSAVTADLAGVRRDGGPPERTSHPDVELLNAGHIPGSRAVLVDAGDERVLYTGDVSTRDRFFLEGFEPVDADVLVMECTYGDPRFVFEDQRTLEGEIVDWLEATRDRPVLLMGYALGRAQELQLLAKRAGRSRVLVTDAVAALNEVIERHYDVAFGAESYGRDVDLGPGDALVLPAQTNTLSFVERLRESADAIKAGFSGWAVESSYRYRGDYDETFVLSDHCDFEELVSLVEAVDPDRVYTQHGDAAGFASHLTAETGYDATALRRNQRSLDEF